MAIAAFFVAGYEIYGFTTVHSLFGDFRAFWCAGQAVLHHADPYARASLAPCERTPVGFGFYSAPANVTVPAPLPPYALLLFVPFALLSFPVAAVTWAAGMLAAVVCAVLLLVQALRVPASLAVSMLLLAVAVLWLPFGEATPLALLGIAITSRALQGGKRWAIAAGLIVMAVEPHVALGAWICVALFVPSARVAIVVAGVVLLACSNFAHAGALQEYLGAVLPLHALAEVPRTTQYSATWIAFQSGLSAHAALVVGEIVFAIMLMAGVACAGVLAKRWNEPVLLALVPPAFAVVGGTFVHSSQVVLATPLAAFLAVHQRGRMRTAPAIACGVLAIPWLQGGQQQTVVLVGVLICAAVIFTATCNTALTVRVAAGAALFAALLVVTNRHASPVTAHARLPAIFGTSPLASGDWGRYVWSEQAAATPQTWAAKTPTWLALLLLVGRVTYALANQKRVARVRVQHPPLLE